MKVYIILCVTYLNKNSKNALIFNIKSDFNSKIFSVFFLFSQENWNFYAKQVFNKIDFKLPYTFESFIKYIIQHLIEMI